MSITLALAGNPNCGKTTLFNSLTGARQHVGNYPGVTVEKREGFIHGGDGDYSVIDLPGTYSLTAYSEEEVVARDYLVNTRPAVVINIVDAANLERNLYLTLQFLELGAVTCVALNMMDVAKSRGISVDAHRLSELLGVPVVPTVARSGLGKAELIRAARNLADGPERTPLRISYGPDIDIAVAEMTDRILAAGFLTDRYPARWIAVKYMEKDKQVLGMGRALSPALADLLEERVRTVDAHVRRTLDTEPEALIVDYRYGYIQSLIRQGVITRSHPPNRAYLSDRMDRVLTHRLFGPVFMMAIMLGLYHFTFTYSQGPVGWLESVFAWLSAGAEAHLPEGPLKSLIISGIIDGVGGVLGFVPLIAFMFLGIAALEDSGYLARVAYMLDRVFHLFGLHGSSVMPFIISGGIAGGCAVPGIMATRTLKSPRERLATLLTVPFMNCGAKLPVLALLIGAFFADYRAAMMFALTIVSWGGALLVARLLRSTVVRGEPTPFVMELPPYRLPTIRGLLIHTWERTFQYIKKAGTVILGISIVLWAMMRFPGLPADETARFENQRRAAQAAVETPGAEMAATAMPRAGEANPARPLADRLAAINSAEAEARLRHSIAGRMGVGLESVTRYAGFDWRVNIALVGGFAAKEVVVSTLGTAYSLGDAGAANSTDDLSRRLASAPGWGPLAGLSLILFTMFYSPCFVSVVCISREAGSWKWGLFSVVFNTLLALGIAIAVYQVGSMIWR